MRFHDVRLTVDTYVHLDGSDVREALETLGKATGINADELELAVRADSLARVQLGSKNRRAAKKKGPRPSMDQRKTGPL
jgi:hypothetical protein